MIDGYKSPIKIIQRQIEMQMEDDIMKAIQKYDIQVDKEELLKALKYEREQYEKGYQAGLNADKWIPIGQYPSEPCLLCFEDGDILVGFYDYDYDEWTLKSRNDEYDIVLQDGEEPIAWMPLPEAYKGE